MTTLALVLSTLLFVPIIFFFFVNAMFAFSTKEEWVNAGLFLLTVFVGILNIVQIVRINS